MPDHLVLYTVQFKKSTDFSKFIATSCEFSGSDGKFVIVDTEKLFGYSYKKNDRADLVHIK